jgi:hypothetical protein
MVEKLEDIRDDSVRGKLTGFQENADELGAEILRFRGAIADKTALVNAARSIETRLKIAWDKVSSDFKAEKFDHVEAKIRASQAQEMVEIVREIVRLNSEEVSVLRGKVEGVTAAVNLIQKKFDLEAAKYERHAAMEAEENELAAARGRPRGVPKRQKAKSKPPAKRKPAKRSKR